MHVLAFDCATQGCSVAVTRQGRLLGRRQVNAERGQSEILLPMIAALMAENGLDWTELSLIGVTIGPGRFTGLRIGLAAARGLALATGLPVSGVGTAEALAQAVPAAERQGRTLLAVIDGKRADLFVQAFDESLRPLAPPEAMMAEAVVERWPGPLLLVGDGAERLAPLLPQALRSAASCWPDAALVAELAEARWVEGRTLPPQPLYLRPADVTLPAAR